MSILTSDMIGATCTFRTINPNDTTTYTGVIEDPFTSERIAKPFRDIAPYNNACRTADTSISTDTSTLHYFLISVVNASGDTEVIAFAEEWIQPGSFVLASQLVSRTFVIYAPANVTSADIIATNRAAGYNITDITGK